MGTRILNGLLTIYGYNYGVIKARWFFFQSPLIVLNPFYLSLYDLNMKSAIRRRRIPRTVRIETTAFCNMCCVFCPHADMKRPKGTMSDSLYKKIIDECTSLGVQHINFVGMGEPTIDPKLPERVRYAQLRNINDVSLTSNGLFLNEELGVNLIEAGLDRVSISLDAATSKTYEKIHRADFNIVKQNILSLIKQRNERKSKLRVEVSFHEFELNKSEVTLFIREFGDMVDRISFIPEIHDWAGKIKGKFKFKEMTFHKRLPCMALWYGMQIYWDGKVPLCCLDMECEVPLGDVSNSSINNVWNGEKLRWIRGLHLKQQFNKVPLCHNCTANIILYQPWWI